MPATVQRTDTETVVLLSVDVNVVVKSVRLVTIRVANSRIFPLRRLSSEADESAMDESSSLAGD